MKTVKESPVSEVKGYVYRLQGRLQRKQALIARVIEGIMETCLMHERLTKGKVHFIV